MVRPNPDKPIGVNTDAADLWRLFYYENRKPFLARREGVGLHDAILTACQRAKFTPRFAHTPSVIHTVLSYVEAGAGIGIIPDSVATLGAGGPLVFRPLVPVQSVDLVMVWADACTSPAAGAFRTLVAEWLKSRKLWRK